MVVVVVRIDLQMGLVLLLLLLLLQRGNGAAFAHVFWQRPQRLSPLNEATVVTNPSTTRTSIRQHSHR